MRLDNSVESVTEKQKYMHGTIRGFNSINVFLSSFLRERAVAKAAPFTAQTKLKLSDHVPLASLKLLLTATIVSEITEI